MSVKTISMLISADGTQKPARPLFIVCSGAPDVDQDDRSKTPTDSERGASSDVNDDLYLGETSNYNSNLEYDEKSSNEDTNDPLLNGITDDSVEEIPGVQLRSVLVPVRDPVTKRIKHELVPVECKDETGLNIIKSVLIPVEDEYGAVCYEVKKVFVPIRPELTLPQNAPGKSKDTDNPSKGGDKQNKDSDKQNNDSDKQSKDSDKHSIGGDKQIKDEDVKDKLLKKRYELLSVPNMCQFCNRVYDTQQALKRHFRRVHKKPYRCVQCQQAYDSKATYEEHMKIHATDAYVVCPFCQQRYKRMSGLSQHLTRVHSTIEPKFTCDYCGKRFRLKSDLSLHIDKAHVNPSRVCKFCRKTVKNVMLHEWQHEKELKKMIFNYPCHLCTSKFQERSGLDHHLAMHKKGFECDKCNRVFDNPSSLATHKYHKHKPVLPCTICNRTFKYKSSFYRHVLAHAGMRPFKCDICDEHFTQKYCFDQHRRRHPEPLPSRPNSAIAEMAKQILQNN